VPISVESSVDIIDQVLFGTLQGLFDGEYDLNTMVDQLQNTNLEDLMKTELWFKNNYKNKKVEKIYHNKN